MCIIWRRSSQIRQAAETGDLVSVGHAQSPEVIRDPTQEDRNRETNTSAPGTTQTEPGMVGEPGSAQNGATPAQAASNGDRKSTSHSRQPSQASQSGSGVQRRPSQSSQPGVQRKPSQSSKSGDKPQQRGADLAPTQVQAQGAGAAAAAGPAKKSGAELKAQKQAEKAARRAQAKESKAQSGAGAAQQGSGGPWAADKGKGSKAEDHQHQQQQSKAGGQHGGGGGGGGTAAGGQQAVKGAAPPTVGGSGKHLAADQAAAVPQCFAHFSVARRIQPSRVDRDIHPAILLLGQQMATLRMTDGTERLHATLLAFKQVCISLKAGGLATRTPDMSLSPSIWTGCESPSA